jgi:hypothetical protein
MAEILEDFDFTKKRKRASSYPWEEWFDGQIRKLTQEVDFPGSATNFRVRLYREAKRRGYVLQTRVVNDDAIVVQCTGVADAPSGKP